MALQSFKDYAIIIAVYLSLILLKFILIDLIFLFLDMIFLKNGWMPLSVNLLADKSIASSY